MIKTTIYVCNTLVNIKINLFFTFIVKNLGTMLLNASFHFWSALAQFIRNTFSELFFIIFLYINFIKSFHLSNNFFRTKYFRQSITFVISHPTLVSCKVLNWKFNYLSQIDLSNGASNTESHTIDDVLT